MSLFDGGILKDEAPEVRKRVFLLRRLWRQLTLQAVAVQLDWLPREINEDPDACASWKEWLQVVMILRALGTSGVLSRPSHLHNSVFAL